MVNKPLCWGALNLIASYDENEEDVIAVNTDKELQELLEKNEEELKNKEHDHWYGYIDTCIVCQEELYKAKLYR